MHRQKKSRMNGNFSMVVTFLVFVLVLAVLFVGTTNLSSAAGEEGVAATYKAIERAAVLCYATEGFYPPGLAYIEQRYGVQIDYDRYAVRYEVMGSNITPTIRVTAR